MDCERTLDRWSHRVAAGAAHFLGFCALAFLDLIFFSSKATQASPEILAVGLSLHLALAFAFFLPGGGAILLFGAILKRVRQKGVPWKLILALCPFGLAALGALGWYTWQRGIILSAIDYRPLLSLLAWILAACGAFLLLRRRLWASLVALVIIGLVFPLAALLGGDKRGAAIEQMTEHGAILKPIARSLRSWADKDKDGYPSRFCANLCDCDDTSARISPVAPELPGNGIDEDCSGEDLVLIVKEEKKKEEPPTPIPEEKPEDNLPPLPERPNILLMTVDTLRADHLGMYGYERDTSPKLDAWAKKGVVFEQARAQGPMTRFSVPVLMSGRYFSELKRTGGSWPRVDKSALLISEVLQGSGYYTAAFHTIGYLMPVFGMNQGFDHYNTSVIQERDPVHWKPTSDLLTDKILKHVDEDLPKDKPWFLWTYYGDPHSGYIRHEGLKSFGPSIADVYDQEILFTDIHMGRLLDELEKRGQMKNTIIILTSDHGEGLDPENEHDHGFQYHGQTLFDNLLQVPLVVTGPGVIPGRAKTPVGNIDLFPTILELTQLPEPEGVPLRGASLVPFLRGQEVDHPPTFSEKVTVKVIPQKSMVKWPYKLIWKLGVNRFELYDLSKDPNELEPLQRKKPEVLKLLKQEMQVWRSTVLKEIPPVERVERSR